MMCWKSLAYLLAGFVQRTPNRTFVVYPAIVLGARLLSARGRAPFSWQYAPLLAWGYVQYRLAGSYRRPRGGGGPGIDVPPTRLVTTGPYAYCRNPMYLGHLIFLTGLALVTGSKLATLTAIATAYWFNRRVAADERQLAEIFGERYLEYKRRVRRWVPGLLQARSARIFRK